MLSVTGVRFSTATSMSPSSIRMMTKPRPPQIVDYYHRSVSEPPVSPKGTLVEQSGRMRLGPDRPWMPFSAEQSLSADRSEFVWHARFKMAPLVTGVVEDAFVEGEGRLDAKIWGIVPVAHARGLEVDRGELQRYLAELVWCPMALIYNHQLEFCALSDDLVRVWVGDERTYVDYLFDEDGDIVGARTETRSRGDEVQPWEGCFTDFEDFGGIRAPARGKVWWLTPEGRFVYWEGRVHTLSWAG